MIILLLIKSGLVDTYEMFTTLLGGMERYEKKICIIILAFKTLTFQ